MYYLFLYILLGVVVSYLALKSIIRWRNKRKTQSALNSSEEAKTLVNKQSSPIFKHLTVSSEIHIKSNLVKSLNYKSDIENTDKAIDLTLRKQNNIVTKTISVAPARTSKPIIDNIFEREDVSENLKEYIGSNESFSSSIAEYSRLPTDILLTKLKKSELTYLGVFSKVSIHERAWDFIRHHLTLRNRLSSLIAMIEYFILHQPHTNKIRHVKNDVFKIRLTKGLRIPFSIESIKVNGKEQLHLFLWEVLSHDAAEKIHETGYKREFEKLTTLLEDEVIFEKDIENTVHTFAPLYKRWTISDQKRLAKDNKDLPWSLSEKQEAIYFANGPLLLKGNAGSGKTTIAIYRLLSLTNMSDNYKSLYLTYTKYLKDYAKKMYISLTNEENIESTDFFTIEELCKKIIKVNHKYSEQNKIEFEKFRNFPFIKQVCRNNISSEKIWEEFRGVIKGAYQRKNFETGYLEFKEYLNIPRDQSLFDKYERNKIYNVFIKYENMKNEKGLWDDLDLATEACNKLGTYELKYDQVIADEVQDFTSFHLYLITGLSKNPTGIFLTGDTQQIIHPSRFEWARAKEFIWHYLNKFKENNKTYYRQIKVDLVELDINYRSSQQIVELSNRLSQWRNKKFKENNKILRSIFTDEDLHFLKLKEVKSLEKKDKLTHLLMVIVASEETQKAAEKIFPKSRIFLIHEAKGLESKYTIIYRFFSDKSIDFNGVFLNSRQENRHKKRYILNLLNVSITRARKSLFFIDDDFPENFEPLSNVRFSNTDEAFSSLERIFAEVSNDVEYIKLAEELEGRNLYKKAAENFFDGNDTCNGNRCMAIYCENSNHLKKASLYYSNAGLIFDAIRCLEKLNEIEEAFKLLIESDIPELNSEIKSTALEYLTDKKKLARLNGKGKLIANAITCGFDSVDLKTLFDYTLERSRLIAYEIGLKSKSIYIGQLEQAEKSLYSWTK